MSGICGVWALGGKLDGASGRIQAGLDAMVHRGPDGFSVYFDRNVALGHCLLDAGCNGMFVDEDGFAISFDGRIDNREALVERLAAHGPAEPGTERLHDKALLLRLYRCFGESLPQMLRGDFALAIWDPRQAGLFLCRDHFGVRPLFWYRSDRAMYLASEIKALRAMAGGENFPVRASGAIEFVSGKARSGDAQCTLHEGVFRLLPGHWARLDDRGFTVRRYWQLSPGLPVRGSDTAAQLRALLQQAVNRRLRSSKPIGALLSGGIDSSAIVSLIGAGKARRRLEDITVFSLVFEGGEDESHYIEAVETAFGFNARRIDGSRVAALDDCDAIVAEQDQPIPAPNIATFRHFLRAATLGNGVKVVLDGHGGDEAVSYGNRIFQEMAENGHWIRLWRELGECEALRPEQKAIFARLVRTRGLRAWRKTVGRLVRGRRRVTDLVRYTADGRARPAEQAFHLSKLAAPQFYEALEAIDHNAAAAGIEVRMPFLDVDLIEFCVTVPAEEKWVRGVSRAAVREALADVLPPAVAARQDKFDFTDRVRRSMVARNARLVQQALDDGSDTLVPYVDLSKLRLSWQALRENGTIEGEKFQELFRSVMLQRWLQARRSPPDPLPAESFPVPAE